MMGEKREEIRCEQLGWEACRMSTSTEPIASIQANTDVKKTLRISEEDVAAAGDIELAGGVARAVEVEREMEQADDGVYAAQSRKLRNSVISLRGVLRDRRGSAAGGPGLRSAGELITDAKLAVGRGGRGARGALVPLLRGALRAGLRTPRAQPQLAAVARGARGQLGRLGERARRHRAGRVGAAQQGDLGRADRQALGADLRVDERRERRRDGR